MQKPELTLDSSNSFTNQYFNRVLYPFSSTTTVLRLIGIFMSINIHCTFLIEVNSLPLSLIHSLQDSFSTKFSQILHRMDIGNAHSQQRQHLMMVPTSLMYVAFIADRRFVSLELTSMLADKILFMRAMRPSPAAHPRLRLESLVREKRRNTSNTVAPKRHLSIGQSFELQMPEFHLDTSRLFIYHMHPFPSCFAKGLLHSQVLCFEAPFPIANPRSWPSSKAKMDGSITLKRKFIFVS